MAARCRIDGYGELVEKLSGETQAFEPCTAEARFTAVLARERDGLQFRIDVPVCMRHEADLFHQPGYDRSVRIRTTT